MSLLIEIVLGYLVLGVAFLAYSYFCGLGCVRAPWYEHALAVLILVLLWPGVIAWAWWPERGAR